MKNYGTYVQADMKTGKMSNKAIPGQTEKVFTLKGKKYTVDALGNLNLV